VRSTDN